MKRLYILALLLLFSCSEEGAGNEPTEAILDKLSDIPDIRVTIGDEPRTVNLTTFFSSPDSITYTVTHTNESVLSYSVSNDVLTVTFNTVGETNVTVQARTSAKSVTSTFTVTVSAEPDQSPVVSNPLANYSVVKNSSDTTIDISNVFSDPDGDSFNYSVASSDQSKATASISNTILTVSYIANAEGDVTLTLTGTANGVNVNDAFTITLLDQSPIVSNTIAPVNVNLNSANSVIDISNVFSDPDEDSFTYTIQSGDANKVSGSISGNTLTLSYVNGAIGSTTMTLIGTASELSDTTTFSVTINDNSAQILENASSHFSNGDYSDAITAFNELINHQVDSTKAKAYAGLGFSYLRNEQLSQAYSAFNSGSSINSTIAENDIKSGLVFLEYSLNDNYQVAINTGLSILNDDSAFQMMYDSNVNHQDVRLTVAQSYFAQNDYSNCLTHVQALGKLPNSTSNDASIASDLLSALNDLADELK